MAEIVRRRTLVLLSLVLCCALSVAWGLLRRRPPTPLPKLRVEILNGTVVPGLAARCSAQLRSLGQDVVSLGDADRTDYAHSLILDRRGRRRWSERLADELGGLPVLLEAMDGSQVDVTLIVGADAVQTVLAAAAN